MKFETDNKAEAPVSRSVEKRKGKLKSNRVNCRAAPDEWRLFVLSLYSISFMLSRNMCIKENQIRKNKSIFISFADIGKK